VLQSQLMDWPMILPRSDRLVDNGLLKRVECRKRKLESRRKDLKERGR
jgi:hypothetical protein